MLKNIHHKNRGKTFLQDHRLARHHQENNSKK